MPKFVIVVIAVIVVIVVIVVVIIVDYCYGCVIVCVVCVVSQYCFQRISDFGALLKEMISGNPYILIILNIIIIQILINIF